MTMLDHALRYAARGWSVFPCGQDQKSPACANGVHDATSDPARIKTLWANNPNYNIGLAMGVSGLGVIDVDGEAGEASLFNFQIEHGFLPDTREHSTPRGGRHLIYSDPNHTLRNSVGKLGPKLDTRGSQNGRDGYILVPPSTFDGKPYTVTQDRHIGPLPAIVSDAAGVAFERLPASDVSADLPENIGRAISHLLNCPPPTQGQGGDALTVSTLMALSDLGVSEERALALAIEYLNPRCKPPWDEAELSIKVHNAYLYAENGFGCHAIRPTNERIPADAFVKLIAESKACAPPEEPKRPLEEAKGPSFEWGFYDPVTDANLPPITYRDQLHLWMKSPERVITQTYAGPKQHKTNFLMAELFRLATAPERKDRARVAYLALEGSYGVRTMRLKALADYYKVSLTDLKGGDYFFLIVDPKNSPMFSLSNPECVRYAAAFCCENGITDLVIDTQHRAGGSFKENDADDMRTQWENVDYIRKHGRCDVHLAHHSGKNLAVGSRGSSADPASVDQQTELTFDRANMMLTATVKHRKDGTDGFSVPFKVIQPRETDVPIVVPMSKDEMDTITKDPLAPLSIAAVLAFMGCRGDEKAVTSAALVPEILKLHDLLPPSKEAQDRSIKAMTGRLHDRLKSDKRLQAYGRKAGAGRTAPFMWSLPDAEEGGILDD